ncbi:negative regulator of beta-lactamase expression [Rickettsia australis str. Cutlack]|uniref:Negative regulator of beta-lactamase expression n=1 Tax=Rickettsia australis (strain Cutlack) TaxID=1105110 RepID=H8K7W0_RICAC|nr:negative regulator of beta-lactamase expression [Rickettsia australis str. Cutlack]
MSFVKINDRYDTGLTGEELPVSWTAGQDVLSQLIGQTVLEQTGNTEFKK